METSSPPVGAISTWKRIAIISFFSGCGIALVAALAIGSFIWYQSRPTPTKPWNISALVATEPPGFGVSTDGKSLELTYSVKNNTAADYSRDEEATKALRTMIKFQRGELSSPLENKGVTFGRPIFIPAGQEGAVEISVELSDLPTQRSAEANADYHERVRAYLETKYSNIISGLVLYDEANRYQINLPRWANKKQEK